MIVPDEVSDQLKCSLCEGTLAVFPVMLIIYKGDNTAINVCGRCPNIEYDNALTQRNSIYEKLAEPMLFPCRYKSGGCRDQHAPADLVSHETYCVQRPIFCPHTPLASCPWQGSNTELLEHFNDKHRFLVIEDCVTEIDIVTKQEENYLLPFGGQLYVVQFQCNGEADDALRVNVRVVGGEAARNRFQYRLSFYSVEGESSETEVYQVELFDTESPEFRQNSPSTCIVQITELLSALNQPSCIRCRIVITPSVKVVLKSNANGESSSNRLNCSSLNGPLNTSLINEDLQRKLECPVCLAHFKAPVLQCVQGHSLCEACRPESGSCPECRSEFAATRNYALESILQVTYFRCKNDEFGCDYVGLPTDLAAHEPHCPHWRACPLREGAGTGAGAGAGACPWAGSVLHMLQHCRTAHEDAVLDLDVVDYYMPEDEEVESTVYLMHRHQHLFLLHFRCDAAHLYWLVQWLGDDTPTAPTSSSSSSPTSPYAFEISMHNPTTTAAAMDKISMQKSVCVNVTSLGEMGVFHMEGEVCQYVQVARNQVQPFVRGEALEYKVRLIPIVKGT